MSSTTPKLSKLNYCQRRKKALQITDQLADLCAQRTNALFKQRFDTLRSICNYWKQNENVINYKHIFRSQL